MAKFPCKNKRLLNQCRPANTKVLSGHKVSFLICDTVDNLSVNDFSKSLIFSRNLILKRNESKQASIFAFWLIAFWLFLVASNSLRIVCIKEITFIRIRDAKYK
jgi:hypothetical protein